MPKVSVIIPVYNADKYLKECLDSIVNQTLKDIEIICIDDGSNDNSLSILEEYVKKDSRITILKGTKQGAGSARNIGLASAKGEYLSFLDADDFFEWNMLEEMYNNAKENESDIVICNRDKYHIQTKKFRQFKKPYAPSKIKDKTTFCSNDIPNEIFNCFLNSVWNKLFKASFVEKYSLKFQEIKRTNDLCFVHSAMACAGAISYIDKNYVHYRIGQNNNLQATNYKFPLEFTKSLIELKKNLIYYRQYNILKISFKDLCKTVINYNISTISKYPKEVFCLYLYLIFYVLPKIGIPFWKIKYKYLWKSIINIIFSVKNDEDKKHKIITFFGIKIKLKRKKNENAES